MSESEFKQSGNAIMREWESKEGKRSVSLHPGSEDDVAFVFLRNGVPTKLRLSNNAALVLMTLLQRHFGASK